MRSKVGVCAGSEAPRDHLDHLHNLGRQRDLLEAQVFGQLAHLLLVVREDGCVLQHYCDAADAILLYSLQAVGTEPLESQYGFLTLSQSKLGVGKGVSGILDHLQAMS